MKQVKHFLEAVLLAVLMLVFRLLPLDTASAAGGWIGRAIGPQLAASHKALRNLREAFPDLSETEQKKIITGMWDNLGRIMAEYPHLEQIGRERIEMACPDELRAILEGGQTCLIFSAHMANWEICAAAMLTHFGRPLDLTYRAPNNPWTDRLLMKTRSLGGRIRAYPKSRDGGRDTLQAMREGRVVGMLIDQKYNEGVAVPFFGRPAMTNPVFVQFARKFDAPLVPARIERTGGARFTITLYEPLATKDRAVEDVIMQAHGYLENWIRERPEQWLWLHRRWDSQKLEEMKEAA